MTQARAEPDGSVDIRFEFALGMMLQLAGLALLALYFGRRMSGDAESAARLSCAAIAGSVLALLGTSLQFVAASQWSSLSKDVRLGNQEQSEADCGWAEPQGFANKNGHRCRRSNLLNRPFV